MTRIIVAALFVTLLQLPLSVSAHDTGNGDLNLKCSGRSFLGEPWPGNITFVKIRKEELEGQILDASEAAPNWQLFRITRYAEDMIVMCNAAIENCRYKGRKNEYQNVRVIDRVAGIMSIISLMDSKLSQAASWNCKPADGF